LPSCAPQNWRIWPISMRNSRPSAAKSTLFPAIPTSSIRRGMT
ncbi:HTH cro/C1-type domain-containing protein, partial [Dysosmobacter welbionis]